MLRKVHISYFISFSVDCAFTTSNFIQTWGILRNLAATNRGEATPIGVQAGSRVLAATGQTSEVATVANERCSKRLAPSAADHARFRFVQAATDPSTVKTVFRQWGRKTASTVRPPIFRRGTPPHPLPKAAHTTPQPLHATIMAPGRPPPAKKRAPRAKKNPAGKKK